MIFWVRYRRSDGAIVLVGQSSNREQLVANIDADHGVVEADEGVQQWVEVNGVPTLTIDLDKIRDPLCRRVDDEVGAIRRRFITDITGQDATYQLKLAEARAWVDGADPADFPYLSRESFKCGLTMEALVADVLATGTAWIGLIDPELESSRRAAKLQIAAAATLLEMIEVATVDWDGLLASVGGQSNG